MESKTTGKNVIIALLSVLLVVSLAFIGYDKLLKKDINTTSNKTSSADCNSTTTDTKPVEIKELNEEKVKKWVDDNYFIRSVFGNYNKETATNDYTDFLVMYIGMMGEEDKTKPEKYTKKILRSDAETIVKKYFDVENVVINIDKYKTDSTSAFVPSSDDKYYYVHVTVMDELGWNTKYIQASLNNNNEIEVLYALVSLYENGNNAYDYYGFKKVTLKEIDNSYKIIKNEVHFEENN